MYFSKFFWEYVNEKVQRPLILIFPIFEITELLLWLCKTKVMLYMRTERPQISTSEYNNMDQLHDN